MATPDYNHFLPTVSVDTVIFGFHNRELKVLLMEYKKTKKYGLPGGFVGSRENVNTAAHRVVHELLNLNGIPLEQFHTFGDYSRYQPDEMAAYLHANGVKYTVDHWLLKRFISVAYYALVDFSEVTARASERIENCGWYPVTAIPRLMWDHTEIVQKALEALRINFERKLAGTQLLPELFTMQELQALYETIMDKKYLRSGFQRKILAMNVLERVDKKYTGNNHKAPYLYRFREVTEL